MRLADGKTSASIRDVSAVGGPAAWFLGPTPEPKPRETEMGVHFFFSLTRDEYQVAIHVLKNQGYNN